MAGEAPGSRGRGTCQQRCLSAFKGFNRGADLFRPSLTLLRQEDHGVFSDWLWIVFTLIASAAQTVRNSMQKELTGTLGTVGATQVRFFYGLPFAAGFLAMAVFATGEAPPFSELAQVPWTAAGALAQVFATGMMLAAMRIRSFVVAITYTKIEPVLVLGFAVLLLGEVPTPVAMAGVFVATAGVVLLSWPGRGHWTNGWLQTTAFGLGSGALFAVSAVCYRGGILALGDGHFLINASTTLVTALALQTGVVSLYLYVFDRAVLHQLVAAWRSSLAAGFFGALASQFWFLAFSLQSASLVRALALIEIVFAQIVSLRLFRQKDTPREIAGMVVITAGVLMILLA